MQFLVQLQKTQDIFFRANRMPTSIQTQNILGIMPPMNMLTGVSSLG
jgi:hypothetical protein